MKPPKVGILTFSDGRPHVHRELLPLTRQFQERLAARLREHGWEAVTGREIVWTPELARSEGQFLAAERVEATVFNFAIWNFPHLPVVASRFAPGPFLLFSNVNPQYPGLVGMLASAGALDQVGVFCARVSGDVGDDTTFRRALEFLRAAVAVNRLRGETYGLIGGRSMGMYTAQSPLDQWQRQFGIDVEHIDQFEIVRRADLVAEDRVEAGLRWLEEHAGGIHYDGTKLTPQLLKRQIRSYHALRELIAEFDLDFCGIKGQPELTDHFCTMDVAEAFCNDPYDWEGPHDPIVCATEADMDGALTMELFKHLAATPVLFADVRHYDAADDIWDLCNSGQHATYFAGRSFDPAVNLPKVHFYPEIIYFPAGGASVAHIAAPGAVTLARLARRQGRYWMAIVPAEFVEFPEPVARQKAAATTPEWPHAFARFRVPPEEFLGHYDSNHIHGVYGDYVQELIWISKILGFDYRVFA
ncbi:MAG: L-fucose/L-arabinose isomerase family protein [Armatimonadota bacterium]|nr:L-fucose/L-arabinose isomerase family protein [Armatimonadota bacterium]MDR7452517.1 L-fucose/L-arabinose isomerase family protein [Armatimonadota bacterium]MDR7467744.1 L-fucose/L-arabinose isomerase family protein [Armatimonadota bacterium]MDR7494944.1 L-fucose/L-arabinose isomerase family protein [Armatimonadota bacterium]MDR7499791.1 L-fucose/L-arabinose isomerase family protein [Armatimonadota bacterium]